MKISIKNIFCLILAVSMLLLLAGCKGKSDTVDPVNDEPQESTTEEVAEDVDVMDDIMDDMADENVNYDNGIYFEEEDDGAEIVSSKKESAAFVGSWKATSGHAMYQYGNVDINIKDDGAWNGNISDVDLIGTWKETEEGIHLTSDIFDCELMYTKDNVLVMRYSPNEDGEYLTTVLTKK